MTRPRHEWTPLLDEAGEQVGWDTGVDEIRFTSPAAFQKAEGFLQVAMVAKQSKRKKGKVAPKPPRNRGKGQ